MNVEDINMDERFRRFVGGMLSADLFADFSSIRSVAHSGSPDARASVQKGLAALLTGRKITASQWVMLTQVDFDDDAHLYKYLHHLQVFPLFHVWKRRSHIRLLHQQDHSHPQSDILYR